MSTVRSIERRLYVRRQLDRDFASQFAATGGEAPRHMEWNGIWAGYMTFAGVAILLLSFVFGVGFSSLNPLESSSWAEVGRGAAIWGGIAVLIATFLGAWVSGRTPPTTRRHGMMRGVTLWGLVMLTTLLLVGWVTGTAVSASSQVAGSALGAAPAAGVSALQGVLQRNGINLGDDQAAAISSQLVTGDKTGAASALAADANLTDARATDVLDEVATPAAGAATTAGRAVRTGGASLSWGLFWIALIGLGCALLGGAGGGGGAMLRRLTPSGKPAA